MSTKVLSNQRVAIRAGLASGIASWAHPTLAELTALTDVSAAVNWNSFDLNVKASDQKDDRTITDAAGAQSRSPYTNFEGNLQCVMPLVSDTTSVYRLAYNIFSTQRVELVVAVRYGKSATVAPAHGDRWTFYHVIVDQVIFGQGDVSKFFQANLKARDDIAVNYIVPTASPLTITTAALAVVGTASAGTLIFCSAAYEGWDITKAATYTSSDQAKLVQVAPGIFKCVGAGVPTIVAHYPGATDSTPLVITVS